MECTPGESTELKEGNNDSVPPNGKGVCTEPKKGYNDSMRPDNTNKSLKRKLKENDEQPKNKRLTRGIKVDYKYLHDPFPDEEDEDNNLAIFTSEENYAIIAGDELTNLRKAQKSEDCL